MKTKYRVHKFMLEYQGHNGKPPTLDEITDGVSGLNYRSSARQSVRSLHKEGLVEAGREGTSRRFLALER